jgi:hypothetical protein
MRRLTPGTHTRQPKEATKWVQNYFLPGAIPLSTPPHPHLHQGLVQLAHMLLACPPEQRSAAQHQRSLPCRCVFCRQCCKLLEEGQATSGTVATCYRWGHRHAGGTALWRGFTLLVEEGAAGVTIFYSTAPEFFFRGAAAAAAAVLQQEPQQSQLSRDWDV